MADNVTYTVNADSTPPNGTVAATDELADGSHAGKAKLLVSASGDGTAIPATAADGLLVEVSNAGSITFGGLTDAELRATPVPVDASSATVPVSNAGLTALNGAIAGTEVQADIVAALPSGNNNIGNVDIASLPDEGQQTMANSISVAIASNQTALPISGAVTTGGLTDAELRATPVPVDIDAPLGQAAMAASIPVVVASNQSTLPVSAASLPLPTGAATLAEQQTQTASLSVLDDWDETNRAAVNLIAGQVGVAGGSGTDSALTQRVSLATNVALPAGTNNIGDVDVLTLPAIPAGNNNIGDVDIASLPNEGQQTMANSISVAVASDQSGILVVGGAANASPVSGNPVYVAGRASTAIPTDVGADGDSAGLWMNRNGAPVVTAAPHVGLTGSPWSLLSETAQYTTTQTSTVLVAGGAGERIVVTKVQIQAGGTTAGALQLYFGTGAYSRGTSFAIFDGEFAPSATLKPGVVMDGPFIASANGDDVMVTDSAAINPLTITIWYYLLT